MNQTTNAEKIWQALRKKYYDGQAVDVELEPLKYYFKFAGKRVRLAREVSRKDGKDSLTRVEFIKERLVIKALKRKKPYSEDTLKKYEEGAFTQQEHVFQQYEDGTSKPKHFFDFIENLANGYYRIDPWLFIDENINDIKFKNIVLDKYDKIIGQFQRLAQLFQEELFLFCGSDEFENIHPKQIAPIEKFLSKNIKNGFDGAKSMCKISMALFVILCTGLIKSKIASASTTKTVVVGGSILLALIFFYIGEHYFDKKEYNTAEYYYTKAEDLYPKGTKALLMRGIINIFQEDYNEAHDDFDSYLTKHINDETALSLNAMTLLKINMPIKSLQELEKALKADPNNPGILNSFGIHYGIMQDYKKAYQYFQKALDIEPEFEAAFYNRGLFRFWEKDIKGAKEDYNKVLQMNPNDVMTLTNMGFIFYLEKEYQNAILYYSKAVKNYDLKQFSVEGKANLHAGKAAIYMNLNQMGNAQNEFNLALQLTHESYTLLLNYGSFHAKLKRYKQAETYYKKALEIKPNYVGAYNGLAIVYYEWDMQKKALEMYETALSINPNNTQSLTGIGILLCDMGKIQFGIEFLTKALSDEPENVRALYYRGRNYLRGGDFQRGLKDLNLVLEITPEYATRIYRELANAYFKIEKYKKTIEYCSKILEFDPRNIITLKNRAQAYLLTNNVDKGLSDCNTALDINPNDIKIRMLRVLYFDKLNNISAAIADLTFIIENSLDNETALVNRATFYIRLKDYEKALSDCDKVLVKNPIHLKCLGRKIEIYVALKDYKKTIEYCDRFLQLNLDNDVLLFKANALFNLRQYKESAKNFQQLIDRTPENEILYVYLSVAYLEDKQYEKAIEVNNQLLEINPNHADALNNRDVLQRELNEEKEKHNVVTDNSNEKLNPVLNFSKQQRTKNMNKTATVITE